MLTFSNILLHYYLFQFLLIVSTYFVKRLLTWLFDISIAAFQQVFNDIFVSYNLFNRYQTLPDAPGCYRTLPDVKDSYLVVRHRHCSVPTNIQQHLCGHFDTTGPKGWHRWSVRWQAGELHDEACGLERPVNRKKGRKL